MQEYLLFRVFIKMKKEGNIVINLSKFKPKKLSRYDLDCVYWLNGYNKAINYGRQNNQIAGVQEQINQLQKEKEQYISEVKKFADEEATTEAEKYQKYSLWAERKIVFGILTIILFIFISPVTSFLNRIFPHGMLFQLLEFVVSAVLHLGAPIAFVVSAIAKSRYERQYRDYANMLDTRFSGKGKSFESSSLGCYESIDKLYLSSLDPLERQMELSRREQERHNQEMRRMQEQHNREMKQMMEKMNRMNEERLTEQRRTAETTQKILNIEEDRERRYRGW